MVVRQHFLIYNLLYSCEVRALQYCDQIENIQVKFFKSLICKLFNYLKKRNSPNNNVNNGPTVVKSIDL